MVELKAILRRANSKSLIIGDEICRGTEHVSGSAIVASAIINLSKANASFILATHLHEISTMERITKLENVKSFHLSVEHDKKTDSLIFDRKLREGSGEPIYGVTVAKYIINDADFIETANEIKNEILKTHGTLIPDKKSRYNAEVYIDEC
jgi:DNA mismatch repair protein MutS